MYRLRIAGASAAIGILVGCLPLTLAQVPAPAPAHGVSTPGPSGQPGAEERTGTAGSAGQEPKPINPTGLRGPGRFVVLVDAAHGGDDSGAQLAHSTAEKTVTLALSVALRSLLTARGFPVSTTREGNVTLTYDARAQIANHANAAACLSLHASETGTGVHIFVSSLEPKDPSRFVAWKTAQSVYVTRSLKLASTVNSAFEHSSTGGDDGGNGDGGPLPATLTRTSLPGVDSMTCPAVAVEVAPIRGSDRKVITDVTDQQYQSRIVEVLGAAILEWRTDWEESRPGLGAGGSRQP